MKLMIDEDQGEDLLFIDTIARLAWRVPRKEYPWESEPELTDAEKRWWWGINAGADRVA